MESQPNGTTVDFDAQGGTQGIGDHRAQREVGSRTDRCPRPARIRCPAGRSRARSPGRSRSAASPRWPAKPAHEPIPTRWPHMRRVHPACPVGSGELVGRVHPGADLRPALADDRGLYGEVAVVAVVQIQATPVTGAFQGIDHPEHGGVTPRPQSRRGAHPSNGQRSVRGRWFGRDSKVERPRIRDQRRVEVELGSGCPRRLTASEAALRTRVRGPCRRRIRAPRAIRRLCRSNMIGAQSAGEPGATRRRPGRPGRR